MNANAKFLAEARELEGHWAKAGLLEGMDKKYDRKAASILMECTRLHNETGTWDCCDECKEREKKEKIQTTVGKKVAKKKQWWLERLKKQWQL